MKRKRFNKPSEEMVNLLIENSNKNKGEKGFPVSCSFLDKNFNFLNSKVNYPSPEKETEFENHAEYKCYLENITKFGYKDEIIAIITIPPCSNCYDEIFKNNKIKKIYYFIDDVRRKTEKQYLKDYVLNKKISPIYPSSFHNINVKYNIYYIIMAYLGGCLTQKPKGITFDEISSISKKWLKNIQKSIKKDNYLIENISNDNVKSMILKAMNMDINSIQHLFESKENYDWVI